MKAFGVSDMTKAYVGSSEVSKVYLGSDLVWSSTPTPPPYDAEIEYLQSSGTQYINLPMNVAKNTYFEVDMYLIPRYVDANKYHVMSANPYVQYEASFYSINTSTGNITYSSIIGNKSTSGAWGGIRDTLTHYILSTEGKTNDAGTYTALSRPLTAAITGFRLFGSYRNTSRYSVAFKSVKITAGTTVLYNLKAVRVGTVGYMYDTISGELFGNNGSGSFTLGSDV